MKMKSKRYVYMLDASKLKAKTILAGKSIADVAKTIGVSTPTFYKKMCGKSDFTRNEMALLAIELDLTSQEMEDIFFAKNVS